METCVRNGYYEEALELSAHMRRVDKKHGGIPIVKVTSSGETYGMMLLIGYAPDAFVVEVEYYSAVSFDRFSAFEM